MAYDPHNAKYQTEIHNQHASSYVYPGHLSQHRHFTDENRNENNYGHKEACSPITYQSLGTQTIEKVDAATMTDPLQIDFRLTSEYLARCSSSLGLPYVTKYEDNSNKPTHDCQERRAKIDFEIEPQHINGMYMDFQLFT